MRQIALGIVLALAMLVPLAGGAYADDGPIIVGEYGSMTGSQATFGVSTDDGVKLAVKERNAAGGVLGRQIKLICLDDQGKQAEAVTAVTKLIDDNHAVAIIGEVASSLSLAGGEVAQSSGVPMISPSSTNAKVTKIGDMISRVCFIDPFQGYVGASFAKEKLGLTKAAILFDNSQAYSSGLEINFKNAFTKLGGSIVTEQSYQGGDNDFSAQLTAIKNADAQFIYVPGYYTEVVNIARQARKLGITRADDRRGRLGVRRTEKRRQRAGRLLFFRPLRQGRRPARGEGISEEVQGRLQQRTRQHGRPGV